MILFRYLSREIINVTFALTFILLAIFITNGFMNQMSHAASGMITIALASKLIFINAPMMLGFLLPFGFYLAILLVLGRMYSEQEITVMFACGLSQRKLFGLMIGLAFVMSLLVGWLTIVVEPQLRFKEAGMKADVQSEISVDKLLPSRFQALGPNMVFYANRMSRDHQQLRDVFFADLNQQSNQRWDVLLAKNAFETTIHGDRYMEFKQGDRYLGLPPAKDFRLIQFQEHAVLLQSKPVKMIYPSRYESVTKLYHAMPQNLFADAEFHWRIAMPILTLILTLIAVPLSKVNPRQSKYFRLVPALFVFVIYADFIFVGRSWISSSKTPEALGLWWLHGIFLLLALILMCRYFGFNLLGRRKRVRQREVKP